MQAAGVEQGVAEDTVLTEQDKTQLLDYLRRVHGAKDTKNKITLTRRQTTEIKKSDSTGRARTIQVEVKKKRVLVKRDATPERSKFPHPPLRPLHKRRRFPPSMRNRLALREAEARQQAELIARQIADAAEKQQRKRKSPKAPSPRSGAGAGCATCCSGSSEAAGGSGSEESRSRRHIA